MLCMSQETDPSSSRLFSQQNPGIFVNSLPQRTISQLLNATSHVLQQQQQEQSQPSPPPSPGRRQPSPQRPPMSSEELAHMGIKVRDFAYESKLPPIQPYRRPQVQPASPRRLARKQGTDQDVGQAAAKLERVVTEPVDESSQSRREPAYGNMDVDFQPLMMPAEITQDDDWYIPQSQPPLIDSQESDPYVDTPLVTPNGSLQWIRDTTSIPASQLDTESQQPAPEMLSFAQLGFSQPDDDGMDVDLAPALTRRNDSRLSPLTPLSSLSSMSTPHSSPSPPPEVPSPRYNLRKRPSPPPAVESRSRPATRRPPNSGRIAHHKAAVSPKPRPLRKLARSTSRKRDARTRS
ncbi:hypothetical protein BDZ89DRAFT_1330 [Hymenopellis radicata]|nr:hypothetical protein BDZ89DRAFT_1330 [Hymenopellis radicata]